VTRVDGPLVAFLGPSLRADAARTIAPDVHLLPPICQGDLITAVEQLRPRAVLIVDGEFGQSLSVWHKEILAAIRDGIRVVGASSMGALRAAELDRYGMEGVGEIYAYYRDGWMTDDADVALLHGDAESGYRPLTWPLVNVRATATALLNAGLVDAERASLAVDAAQAIHFTERSAGTLEQRLHADGLEAIDAHRLAVAFAAGYVDQKAADAEAGFAHLAGIDDIPAPVADTPLFLDVHTYTSMRGSDVAITRRGVSLRRYQLVNDVALHDPDFERLFERAVERELLAGIAEQFGLEVGAEEIAEQRQLTLRRLGITEETLGEWLIDNDLDSERFENLIQQQAVVARFRRWTIDLRPFDHGRELVIQQLQLEGKYAAAANAAARRRRAVDTSPLAPYPRDAEEITKLAKRHFVRTG
jgi:hypothetical protein